MVFISTTSPSPTRQTHVLAIPYPAQGHINPLMRLCKVLASHGVLITFVNVDPIHNRISDSLSQRPHQEPPSHATDRYAPQPRIQRAHVPIHGLDMSNDFRLSLQDFVNAVENIGPHVVQLVEQLSKEGAPVTCLISDVFMSSMSHKVADKLDIPRIALYPSSQSFNLFSYYLSNGDIDMTDALNAVLNRHGQSEGLFHEALPGLPSLRIADLPNFDHTFNESEFFYSHLVRQCKIAYDKAHGMVVNSFDELEGPSFEALRKNVRPPIYALGPLVEELSDESSTSLWKEEDECLDWLQNQAPQSVLYISFGSITLLSKLQFEEILIGLEASNQRFLWAFRPDLVREAAYTSLPEEFLKRTKDRGYVVRWVPQLRVLSHPSVGGFLTHCGWNSTMEGVANGVPMLCWPYFADQFMDAKYIVEEWKIGLRLEEGNGGFVSGADVEKQVKALMEREEGKLLRKNAAKLRDAGRSSLQAGGSSHKQVQAFVEALLSYTLQRP